MVALKAKMLWIWTRCVRATDYLRRHLKVGRLAFRLSSKRRWSVAHFKAEESISDYSDCICNRRVWKVLNIMVLKIEKNQCLKVSTIKEEIRFILHYSSESEKTIYARLNGTKSQEYTLGILAE